MAEARRLILLRHGRTAWNETGRAQGHADVELDDVGHAQAAAAAAYLATLAPAALWSSDLGRARQTCVYLEKETGLTATYDPVLREYDVGARQGLTLPEFAERFPAEHAAWLRHDQTLVVPGEESTADVAARIVPAMQAALWSVPEGRTGVVVTHGAALKVGLLGVLGWPQSLSSTLYGIDNCAWATVEAAGPDPQVRLVGYNESVRPGHDAPAVLPDEG